MRHNFLTLRCAGQYLGFVADRLHKAKPELDLIASGDASAASRFSKCLYHAWHKLFELARVLRGEEPVVALKGDEHSFVMGLRLRPPRSGDEARTILEEAKAKFHELGKGLDEARVEKALPAEVNAGELADWLHSVRARQAAAAAKALPSAGSAPLKLTRSVSSRSTGHDDREAIAQLLDEVEKEEGIRIVHAGYAPSSRTLGTSHEGSDHDVHVIFALPRSAYFGLHEPMQKFRRSFPATGYLSQVDISGWEVRHACRMLAQSNPSTLHVLHSPVEFATTRWSQRLRCTARQMLNKPALALAWWKHGRQNYQDFIKRKEEPIRKKYVHVLRPLLCLKWLLQLDWEASAEGASDFFPPAPLLDLARSLTAESSSKGGLSEADLASIEDLAAQPERLPLALPREPPLDELIEGLLGSTEQQLADRGVATAGRAPLSNGSERAWHELCVAIVEEMSAFATERELPDA